MSSDKDKRTKVLNLTKKGYELENKLSEIQINNIKTVFSFLTLLDSVCLYLDHMEFGCISSVTQFELIAAKQKIFQYLNSNIEIE